MIGCFQEGAWMDRDYVARAGAIFEAAMAAAAELTRHLTVVRELMRDEGV